MSTERGKKRYMLAYSRSHQENIGLNGEKKVIHDDAALKKLIDGKEFNANYGKETIIDKSGKSTVTEHGDPSLLQIDNKLGLIDSVFKLPNSNSNANVSLSVNTDSDSETTERLIGELEKLFGIDISSPEPAKKDDKPIKELNLSISPLSSPSSSPEPTKKDDWIIRELSISPFSSPRPEPKYRDSKIIMPDMLVFSDNYYDVDTRNNYPDVAMSDRLIHLA